MATTQQSIYGMFRDAGAFPLSESERDELLDIHSQPWTQAPPPGITSRDSERTKKSLEKATGGCWVGWMV